MFGAEPGPTDLLREKSLESRDSPGESEAGGRVVEAERSFSEERLMDQDRLSLSFSLREIVLNKLSRPESSPLLQHHDHHHPRDHLHGQPHPWIIIISICHHLGKTWPWPGRS
jgi:hypothetical protein